MNTNLSKRELQEEYRTLRDALKKAGYDPDRIIRDYIKIYGEREVVKRDPDVITAKGLKLLKGFKKIPNKALGLEDEWMKNQKLS